MKRFTLVTVAALAMTLSVCLAAHAFAEGGPGRKGNPMQLMLKKLNLSDAQKQQAKGIFAKYDPQIHPLMKQMMTERRALRALVQADLVDEAAIRAEAAKVAAIAADLAVQRANIFHDIKGILTPDQTAKLKEMQARMDQRIQKRMQHHEDHIQ